jgi:hypothetical protein
MLAAEAEALGHRVTSIAVQELFPPLVVLVAEGAALLQVTLGLE